MKRELKAGLWLVALGAALVAAQAVNTKVYREQGGERFVVGDGGTLYVGSGGTASVASGGTLSIASGGLFKTADGVGVVAGTGNTAVENLGLVHKTVISLTAFSVSMTDAGGAQSSGGGKIYDFPEGAIYVVGATASLTLTAGAGGIVDAFDGDFSMGSVVAAADATLTSTEADILPTTGTVQGVSGVGSVKSQSTASQNIVIDGTTTAVDVYLNLLVDDADSSSNDTLAVTGTVTLYWVNLGDY